MPPSPERPLAGVRVVDTSRNAPGPLATMMMADFGAEVIHVARPVDAGFENYAGGLAEDPYTAVRFQPYDAAMRGKRSIALDLKSAAGRAAMLRLCDTADVFVEEMRPGKAAKLGLGYDELAARNSRLIYCSISGFGQTGPLRNAPGHDLNYLALSGALGLIRDAEDRPVNPQNVLADNGGGTMSALAGVLLALIARERTGRGQHVDVSITDATMALMTDLFSTAIGGGFDEGGWRRTYTGEAPHFRPYRCACGGWLVVAALEARFSDRFFARIGRSDLAQALDDRARWPWIHAELEALIATRSRDDWVALFEGEEACVTPVLSLAEAANSAQALARGMVSKHHGIRQIGIAPRLSATPGAIAAPPVAPGADSAEILADLGFSESEIARNAGAGRHAIKEDHMNDIPPETADYRHLIYEVDKEHVCWLTLNRPEKLNAMNLQLIAELQAGLLRADRDEDVNVVVIRGAGRGFCAGHDLDEDAAEERSSIYEYRRPLLPPVRGIHDALADNKAGHRLDPQIRDRQGLRAVALVRCLHRHRGHTARLQRGPLRRLGPLHVPALAGQHEDGQGTCCSRAASLQRRRPRSWASSPRSWRRRRWVTRREKKPR